ncbi:hypothetical protein OUZ56_030027 [Daphnia magna]|uniref:Carboxypeptidase activation peptide domain-containing protein n=1 Tax=Daphnia magna TaxID=35525 RepID=A0ABR0B8J7_9CRUS|nr:hypothetical protein OUZ56_030027 [Daphnia magna]
MVIRVVPQTEEQVKFLSALESSSSIDFWTRSVAANRFTDIHVSPESYNRVARALLEHGMNHKIHIANLGVLGKEEQQSIALRRALASNNKAIDVENYHTYEEQLVNSGKLVYHRSKSYACIASGLHNLEAMEDCFESKITSGFNVYSSQLIFYRKSTFSTNWTNRTLTSSSVPSTTISPSVVEQSLNKPSNSNLAWGPAPTIRQRPFVPSLLSFGIRAASRRENEDSCSDLLCLVFACHRHQSRLLGTEEQVKFLSALESSSSIDFWTRSVAANRFTDIHVSPESYNRVARALLEHGMNHKIHIANLGVLGKEEQQSIALRRALASNNKAIAITPTRR